MKTLKPAPVQKGWKIFCELQWYAAPFREFSNCQAYSLEYTVLLLLQYILLYTATEKIFQTANSKL